jgi:hypothetical protein
VSALDKASEFSPARWDLVSALSVASRHSRWRLFDQNALCLFCQAGTV